MQPGKQSNILEEILTGRKDNAAVNWQDETSQLLYLFAEPVPKSSSQPIKNSGSGTKRKSTHYLTPGTREKLENFRRQLLYLCPDARKNTFSRSNIVDKSLQFIINRFHFKHDRDELLNMLLG